jgi:hypothetical protein
MKYMSVSINVGITSQQGNCTNASSRLKVSGIGLHPAASSPEWGFSSQMRRISAHPEVLPAVQLMHPRVHMRTNFLYFFTLRRERTSAPDRDRPIVLLVINTDGESADPRLITIRRQMVNRVARIYSDNEYDTRHGAVLLIVPTVQHYIRSWREANRTH